MGLNNTNTHRGLRSRIFSDNAIPDWSFGNVWQQIKKVLTSTIGAKALEFRYENRIFGINRDDKEVSMQAVSFVIQFQTSYKDEPKYSICTYWFTEDVKLPEYTPFAITKNYPEEMDLFFQAVENNAFFQELSTEKHKPFWVEIGSKVEF